MARYDRTSPQSSLPRVDIWREPTRILAPLAVFLASVGLGTLSADWLGEGYASLIFVLGITVIGAMSGLAMALASAVAGAITFNYYVSVPIHAISFSRGADFAPPLAFIVCAILSGGMAGRLQDRNRQIDESSRRLAALLEASRELQAADGPAAVLAVLDGQLRSRSAVRLGLFMCETDGLVPVGDSGDEMGWPMLARAVLDHDGALLREGRCIACRLTGGSGAVGVMLIAHPEGNGPDEDFLLTLAGLVALALERAQLAGGIVDARAMARTEELKTSLLASVSHDMRTPLTSISTAAASLLAFEAEFDAETSRQLLAGIVSECDRLDRLTANLLEMTRLQSGGEHLRRSVLPVAEMISAVVARLDGANPEPRLSFEAPPEEIAIEADTALFDLALTNIVENALRYSPGGSAVCLRCAAEGDDCVIGVTDHGPGIPRAQQERVFERFHRLHSSPGAPKATGLGLAIAKGFVEAFDGRIDLVSPVAAGHGTRITIRLPLARPAGVTEPVP